MLIELALTPEAVMWFKVAAALIAGALVTGLLVRLLKRQDHDRPFYDQTAARLDALERRVKRLESLAETDRKPQD